MVRTRHFSSRKGQGEVSSSGTAPEPPVSDSTGVRAPSSSRRSARTSSSAQPNVAPGDDPTEVVAPQEYQMEPLPPIDLWWSHTCFSTPCKLSTACDDVAVVQLIEDTLEEDEWQYFYRHPQFKHVFHMPRLKNHRLRHLWFTLLRTVKKNKGKVAWFLVNGVPIRYSIKEHALISGLSCVNYPRNSGGTMGSNRFAIRTFGRYVEEGDNRITQEEVLNKFKDMPKGDARVKTGLLLLLSTVICKPKTENVIDPFLIRAVDDLEACKKFPWGRFTFDDQISQVWKTVSHFKGRCLKTYMFPGFFHPLSMLVCEAIPVMKDAFRVEPDDGIPDISCPRMCKSQWAPLSMKGWPLEEINHVLGETRDIHSILTPTTKELPLLQGILDDKDLNMGEDELTLNWHGCIDAKKKIFFEEYFKRDVAGRKDNVRPTKAKSLKEKLMEAIEAGLGKLKEELTVRLDKHLERILMIETCVNDLMSWRAKTVSEKEAAGDGSAGAGVEGSVGAGVEGSVGAAAKGNEDVSGEGFEDACGEGFEDASGGDDEEEDAAGEEDDGGEEDDAGDDDDDDEDVGEDVGDDEEDDEACSDLEFAQILADVKRKGKEIAQDKDNTQSKKAKRG